MEKARLTRASISIVCSVRLGNSPPLHLSFSIKLNSLPVMNPVEDDQEIQLDTLSWLAVARRSPDRFPRFPTSPWLRERPFTRAKIFAERASMRSLCHTLLLVQSEGWSKKEAAFSHCLVSPDVHSLKKGEIIKLKRTSPVLHLVILETGENLGDILGYTREIVLCVV